ncbi:hypothetical protein D3C81_1373520 [compost metagenome]
MKVLCKQCGHTKIFIAHGTLMFGINDKLITVVGIEHYSCEFCGRVSYPRESPIVEALRHAYKEGYNVVTM